MHAKSTRPLYTRDTKTSIYYFTLNVKFTDRSNDEMPIRHPLDSAVDAAHEYAHHGSSSDNLLFCFKRQVLMLSTMHRRGRILIKRLGSAKKCPYPDAAKWITLKTVLKQALPLNRYDSFSGRS